MTAAGIAGRQSGGFGPKRRRMHGTHTGATQAAGLSRSAWTAGSTHKRLARANGTAVKRLAR
jgi:hypothetical protein